MLESVAAIRDLAINITINSGSVNAKSMHVPELVAAITDLAIILLLKVVL